MSYEQRVRTTGWRMGMRAGETIGFQPEHPPEPAPKAFEFTWPPTLVGDTIQYQVTNPSNVSYSRGEVVDHIWIAGVGLEDGIEFASHEDTRELEDDLGAWCVYDGEIGLPGDLPDGIYGCQVTADYLHTWEPRPIGAVPFRVVAGVIEPM